MPTYDPRSLSFTKEEQTLGSSYNPYGQSQPAPTTRTQEPTLLKRSFAPPPSQQVIAEVNEDFTKLADRIGVETQALVSVNPDDTKISAGAVYNVPYDYSLGIQDVPKPPGIIPLDTTPQFGGLTEEEQFRQDQFGVGGQYIDFLTYQETLDVTGINKFGGRTSQSFETDFGTMQIPEGFNFQEFRMFAENTKDTGFWDEFQNTSYSVENILNLPAGMGEAVDPRFQSYTAQELAQQTGQYYPESIIETGGIPTFPQWEKNPVTGEWNRKPPEAIFDELYRINGIDPNDPEAVEWFWSLANEDMLYAAEFFDVIEWPQGSGYGGYGGMPTPYRQTSKGRQPSRGDYASYVSLTSWSI